MDSLLWYVTQNNKEHGPYTSLEMKNMAAKGFIVQEDLVRRSDMKVYYPANRIKGLFEQSKPEPQSTTITSQSFTTEAKPFLPIQTSMGNFKFDWAGWSLGGKIIFISACIAFFSMFLNWVDLGFVSANGFNQGSIFFLGVYIYPLWKLLTGQTINQIAGIIWGGVGFILTGFFMASKQIEIFGTTTNASGSGALLFLLTCGILIYGVVMYHQSLKN